jgi:hypothetical protein
MTNQTKFKVGDKVKITSPGKTYSTYEDMFIKLGFKNCKVNNSWQQGTEGAVFATGEHQQQRAINLLAVRRVSASGEVSECLISEDGVTYVDHDSVTITRKDIQAVMKLQDICSSWKKKIAAQFAFFEDECTVSRDFIEDCYSEANTSVREFLEKRFPDVFKKIEAISLINGNIDSDFNPYQINSLVGVGIVKGLAGGDGIPKELRGRALYYNSSTLQLNVMECGNNKSIIYFTKK